MNNADRKLDLEIARRVAAWLPKMSLAGEAAHVFCVAMFIACVSTLMAPAAAFLEILTPDELLAERPAARHMAGVVIATALSVGGTWLLRHAAHTRLKKA